MKRYLFSFDGRPVTAIGKTYKCRHTFYASTLAEAIWMLYGEYEHITMHTVLESGHAIPLTTYRDTKPEKPADTKSTRP